jgi:hypothetical protein
MTAACAMTVRQEFGMLCHHGDRKGRQKSTPSPKGAGEGVLETAMEKRRIPFKGASIIKSSASKRKLKINHIYDFYHSCL